MKLVRYGPAGGEKPGMLDADGTLRDLSPHVEDIAGATLSPEGLDRLRAIDPASLPPVEALGREGRTGDVLDMRRQVAQHSVCVEHARLLPAGRTVANQFHLFLLN